MSEHILGHYADGGVGPSARLAREALCSFDLCVQFDLARSVAGLPIEFGKGRRDLRARSEARKRATGHDPALWADVDADAARACLQQAHATTYIHGHTHRPATHDLGQGLQRVVLSDWDAAALPPRLETLRLSAAGLERVKLAPTYQPS